MSLRTWCNSEAGGMWGLFFCLIVISEASDYSKIGQKTTPQNPCARRRPPKAKFRPSRGTRLRAWSQAGAEILGLELSRTRSRAPLSRSSASTKSTRGQEKRSPNVSHGRSPPSTCGTLLCPVACSSETSRVQGVWKCMNWRPKHYDD